MSAGKSPVVEEAAFLVRPQPRQRAGSAHVDRGRPGTSRYRSHWAHAGCARAPYRTWQVGIGGPSKIPFPRSKAGIESW
jgi:hypothetical protein